MSSLSLRLKLLPHRVSKQWRKSHERTSAIPNLPEDAVELILAYRFPDIPFDSPDFDPNDQYRSDAQYKAAVEPLCLVARSWLNPARRVLYRTITEYYNNGTTGQLLWNTIMNFPHIRPYIRRMYFQTKVLKAFFQGFSTLLPCCTILFCEASSGAGGVELLGQSDSLGYLRAGSGGSGAIISSHVWSSGFENWTRLQVLEFSGDPSDYPKDPETEGICLLPALRVLKYRRIHSRIPIPPTTPNTLHTLIVSSCNNVDSSVFRNLVLRHSSSLTRVAIERLAFAGGVPDNVVLDDVIAPLQSLTSLILHGMQPLSNAFFLSLPSSLVNLTFSSAPSREAYDYCTSLLNTRRDRRKLRLIEMYTYGVGFDSENLERWDALADGFIGAGVTLSWITWHERTLPHWAREW
jgi:hypothetical protein